ncbi:glycosyltransferase family 39 protein [Candidatus Microgenomates bacterium]|nr:glycosyltransferase family 39 protein [Candidatus Microgenomates bacterium]
MFAFLKSHKLLIAVFLLALFLRIFKLGEFPVGFHVDEAKAGWNAYSILKTGQDDRGNKFALYYNSFGDYRPTGIFYTIIPSLVLFGKSEFAVRFPSALLGALTIFPLYFLVNELSRRKKLEIGNWKLEILAASLLAVSPWHISVSRATSEVAISMFIALSGLYFIIRFLNSRAKKFLLAGVLLLVLSYFFYHSVRILIPLFVAVIVFYYWKSLGLHIGCVGTKRLAVGGLVIVSLATFFFSLSSEARGRFSQVSVFNDLNVQHELEKMPFEEGPNRVFVARLFHNKPSVYARRFIEEYSKYFSPDFLISKSAAPARYVTVGMGVLTYIEALLFIIGLVAIAQKKASVLPLLLLFVAPIPAALTTEDSPNLHRALFMLPFILIIGAYGLQFLTKVRKWGKLLFRGALVLLTLNFIFYLHMYYVHNKVHIPLYRNIGAKELAVKIAQIQNSYNKIILTNIPDDPYPWIAFFTGQDPAVFNKDAVTREKGNWMSENLVFVGQRCPSRDAFTQIDVERLLVVDAEGCASESNLKGKQGINMEEIKRTDGTVVYTLWSTQN